MKKIAIVGAGCAGLSCAYVLEKSGIYDVTVFDRMDDIGGCVMTGKVKDVNGNDLSFDGGGPVIMSGSYHNLFEIIKLAGKTKSFVDYPFSIVYDLRGGKHWSKYHSDDAPETVYIKRFQMFVNFMKWHNYLFSLFGYMPYFLGLSPLSYLKLKNVLPLLGIPPYVYTKIIYTYLSNIVVGNSAGELPVVILPGIFSYVNFFEKDKTQMIDGSFYEMWKSFAEKHITKTKFILRTNVTSVKRNGGKVTVKYNKWINPISADIEKFGDKRDEKEMIFDKIIFTVGSNIVSDILEDQNIIEKYLLKITNYIPTSLTIHHDNSYLIRQGIWNQPWRNPVVYTEENVDLPIDAPTDFRFDRVLSDVQPWLKNATKPCISTWNNKKITIDPRKIDLMVPWQHPKTTDVVTTVIKKIILFFLNGRNNTYYAGDWVDVNTHEGCVVTGLQVGKQLTGIYPFNDNVKAKKVFKFGHSFYIVSNDIV